MYFEENDYGYDEIEFNEKGEYTEDILSEFELDDKIEILNYYKNILIYDPDFIGFKNLSSMQFLNIIENTNNSYKPKSRLEKRKEHKITNEQYNIFSDIFMELNIEYDSNKLQNIIDKIFNLIYV